MPSATASFTPIFTSPSFVSGSIFWASVIASRRLWRERHASRSQKSRTPSSTDLIVSGRIGNPGPPHGLPVRPDVLDVRDDTDDEDAVHLRAERRDDVRGWPLAGAFGLQVGVVVLGGEEPPRDLPDHADPSRPSSISRASAWTSTLSSFADSTIIMSP